MQSIFTWIDNEPISLLSAACIANGRDKYHDTRDLRYPSWLTVQECVLPIKIHFRYCWLFSGICDRRVTATESLTDQEAALQYNRRLMSDKPVVNNNEAHCTTINAFWLLTDGRLVLIDDIREEYKLRNIRAYNLRYTRDLWTTHPNSCATIIHTASLAYDAFIRICEEAVRLSVGDVCFHNVYATYPLAIVDQQHHTVDDKTNVRQQTVTVHERDVRCCDITTGCSLLASLDPLYHIYFDFILRGKSTKVLRESVGSLGAESLVDQERFELQIAYEIKHSWFARILVRVTMLLFSMY